MDASQPFPIPCLTDNFVWVSENARKEAFVVDPGECAPVEKHLTEKGLKLTHILITHYHFDHIAGAAELSEKTGAEIWAPHEAVQPSHKTLKGGMTEEVGGLGLGLSMQVIDTPGHALRHVSLYFPQLKSLFCGDVLFALGCGRLFDGSAEEMWLSLTRLRALPPDTRVCCGHDYTAGNLRFLRSLKGLSAEGERVVATLEQARARAPADQTAGLPTCLKDEISANPFLLAGDESFLRANDIACPAGAEGFKELRKRKDMF